MTADQRIAAGALGAAAFSAWSAPLAGIEPWWPFIAVVALTRLVARRRIEITIPWRLAIQIAGLVIVVEALGIPPTAAAHPSLPLLLAVAVGIGAVAALINNLPASVWAATLLSAGPDAYSATIGLAVGALATPQGSVATLIAADLAGSDAPAMSARRLAPLAITATFAATLLLGLKL